MTVMKFIHAADIHLDTPFFGREESVRTKLKEATREAFSGAVRAAVERGVHAFLVAGDLFDNERLTFASERFLLREMARLREAGIQVFYATGNHDPGRANYRARQMPWPDNVHLFSGTAAKTVAVSDAQGRQVGWLTSAGHNSPRESANLAGGFGRARPDLPHVAMLHAHVSSGSEPGEHEIYAPCGRRDLESPGFDYWALGHIHRRHRVFEDLPAWYAGNIQGRNPRETGPKGVCYVEVAKGGVQEHEFIPLSPVVWDWLEISCPHRADSFQPLADGLCSEILRCIDASDGRQHFVRVDLTGQSPLAEELSREGENLQTLTEEVQAESGVSRLEIRPQHVTRPVDVDEYRGSETVLGEALDILDRLQGEDRLLDRVRPSHLALRDEPDEREYLRGLLRDMERELASRLLPGGNGS